MNSKLKVLIEEVLNREVTFKKQFQHGLLLLFVVHLASIGVILEQAAPAASAFVTSGLPDPRALSHGTATMSSCNLQTTKTGMKITLKISGGFAAIPGLSKPMTIDTTLLEPSVASELIHLVQSSAFFERPTQIITASPGAADYQTYKIEIENGPNVHSIYLTDPVTDPALLRLLTKLQEVGKVP